MGEIRIQVKVTNAGDETLARRGQMALDQIRSYEANAMVDTGAVCTILPVQVVQQLGLAIVSQRVAEFADGRNEIVGVTEAVTINIGGRRTADEALVLGDEILIGQTVLEKLDLLADCANHMVVPNPAHPDQPVNKVKQLVTES